MDPVDSTVTSAPGATIAPNISTGPSVTISLTTLIIILCAAIVVAAFIALLVSILRQKAQGGTAVQPSRRWPQIVFAGVGIAAAVGLCVTALSGSAALPVSTITAEPQLVVEESAASEPMSAPTPEPAALTRPEGMPEELYNSLAELCYDLVYYSNYYCGAGYSVAGPPHHTAYENLNRCWEFKDKYKAVESSALIGSFESAFMDIWNYESFLSDFDQKNMAAGVEFAIQECEETFAVDFSKIQFDAGNKTFADDAVDDTVADDLAVDVSAAPQGDYLTGKVFATEGYDSGGMFVEGQAFYFENGSVYVGLPDESASSIKENSSLFTPFTMSYSLDGYTVAISGGGGYSEWTYDASQDVLNAAGTILERID